MESLANNRKQSCKNCTFAGIYRRIVGREACFSIPCSGGRCQERELRTQNGNSISAVRSPPLWRHRRVSWRKNRWRWDEKFTKNNRRFSSIIVKEWFKFNSFTIIMLLYLARRPRAARETLHRQRQKLWRSPLINIDRMTPHAFLFFSAWNASRLVIWNFAGKAHYVAVWNFEFSLLFILFLT